MGGFRMGPRILMLKKTRDAVVAEAASPVLDLKRASRVMGRTENTCDPARANLCEKPVGQNILAIAFSVAIPAVAVIVVLIVLHRRNVKRQRQEDLHDPHKSMDFGLDKDGAAHGEKRRSLLGATGGKAQSDHKSQMSMDMNLSSPYLLPLEMQGSRGSMHSLARTIPNSEDPYQLIKHYPGSDCGSVRNPRRSSSSVYTPSYRDSKIADRSRWNSMTKTSLSIPEAAHVKPSAWSEDNVSPPPPAYKEKAYTDISEPVIPQTLSTSREPRTPCVATPAFQKPPAAASPPASMTQPSPFGPADKAVMNSLDFNLESRVTPPTKILPPTLSPAQGPAPATVEDRRDVDYTGLIDGQHVSDWNEQRGRNMHRQSHLNQPQPQSALTAPYGQDDRRLSVGFRPLPPDDIMGSEDPEYRANRIRSFYKEYFEEKPGAIPPVSVTPLQHQQQGVQHHENFDIYYMGGDAAYFNPVSNAFVMPYAQNVARRAMTPPPSGQRFHGDPRGPGPMFLGGPMRGGLPMPGSPVGIPRPGSSASYQWDPPRPGSTQSFAWGRPGSTQSGARAGPRTGSAMAGPQKPKWPPPAALSTLPTPSKLKDDSFSLLSSIDFAPPESFASRARGRSQSPMGERRPYQVPSVPAHSPLVTAFDELAALPSPHLLNNSDSFNLNFAPPRKFANDNDARSDAGSIRSNRSGVSIFQQVAIRSGAGRVSRLPDDTVFTVHAMQDQLKPQWGMQPI